jgi:hypothetical protein
MKWMLIIVVLGAAPVKTDLIFDSPDECLKAEESVRTTLANAYNSWLAWAKNNQSQSGYPNSGRLAMKRIGLENQGTCIPHAPPWRH